MIYETGLEKRLNQVIEQTKRQKQFSKKEVQRRCYKLIKKFNHQQPRGNATKRLRKIESARYIDKLVAGLC